MTSLEDYPADRFDLDMTNLCAAYPERRNPVWQGACTYHHPSGGRCIIGQWLDDLGLSHEGLTGNSDPAYYILAHLGGAHLASRAMLWQRAADCPAVDEGTDPLEASLYPYDHGVSLDGSRVPWGAVPALVASPAMQRHWQAQSTTWTVQALNLEATLRRQGKLV